MNFLEVFLYIPTIIFIVFFTYIIHKITSKKFNIKNKLKNIIISFLAASAIEIIIGLWLFYSYKFNPNGYSPDYINTMNNTPVDEFILDVLLWPFLWLQSIYLSISRFIR